MFGHFSHIFYTCIFALMPLFFIWLKHHRVLWLHKSVIGKVLIIGIIYAITADSTAIKILGIWGFDENKIINFWIAGMPIDDLFFAVVVFAIVSSVTILFCIKEEKKH